MSKTIVRSSALLLIFFSTICAAQEWKLPFFKASAKELLEAASAMKSDPKAPSTVLLEEAIYEFDAQSRVTSTMRRVYRVESAKGVQDWASLSIRWRPWYQERPELKARVIGTDGSEKVLDTASFTDSPVENDSSILYSDERIYQGPLPSVAVGSIVETEIVLKDRDPFLAEGVAQNYWVGYRHSPVLNTRVILRAPKSLPLKYALRLMPNAMAEKSVENGIVEIAITNGATDPQDDEEDFVPGEVPMWPRVAFSTGASWAAIAEGYAKLSDGKLDGAEAKRLALEAVKSAKTDDEKIRKVVSLLHSKVRYTGIEFGSNALIPHPSDETLKRGYGDCKDKAALLVNMLRSVGINAHMALLQTGVGEDNQAEFPGMKFNHAIVVVNGTPDLWIDATADDYSVGSLPFADRDRLALVIAPGTQALTRISMAKPEDNRQSETREFQLPEFGPAKVVETTLATGSRGASYRSLVQDTNAKDLTKNLTTYVKSVYLATDEEPKFTHSDPKDLSDPARLTINVEKAKRGQTSMIDAAVYFHPYGLFNNLPRALKGEDEKDDATPEEKAKYVRKKDIYFDPVLDEWHYRIVPPVGFKVRALPESATEDVGPAKLTYKYSVAPDGAVLADISFNPMKGRYTPAEVESMKAAIKQIGKRDGVLISFDQTGHLLQTQGKTKEALEEFESLAAKHPTEALHRVQVANALVSAGLCETARAEAKKATVLDPKSAQAFAMLGWVMEHDLICRRFKKGFDLQAGIEAYRKAKELDPKELDHALNLAILLEYNKAGERYEEDADLKAAIETYRAVKEVDKNVYERYHDNILYDLLFSKQYKELEEELKTLPSSDGRKGMLVAAIAGQSGAQAAIERSRAVTSDEVAKSKALIAAANHLMTNHDYATAAVLYREGSRNNSNSAALLAFAEVVAATKAWNAKQYDDTTPEGFARLYLAKAITNRSADDAFLSLLHKDFRDTFKESTWERILPYLVNIGIGRQVRDSQGFSPKIAADVVLSTMNIAKESDGKNGFRVAIEIIGTDSQALYVVPEGGHYKLLGTVRTASGLGRHALGRLKEGDVATARKYLDWARGDHKIPGGDDVLAGDIFPRLWEHGSNGGADKVLVAALGLVADDEDAKRWIPDIESSRAKATGTERDYLTEMLAAASGKEREWKTARAMGKELMEKYPNSLAALSFYGRACVELKDASWEPVVKQRVQTMPDKHSITRMLAEMYTLAGDTTKANEVYTEILKSGRSTPEDLNSYAWNALVAGKVTDDAVEQVRRAVATEKNYAIVHTLASLYAETGKTKEARELLLQIMDDNLMEEPDDSLWYVFGRIAEQYGETAEAVSCYKRLKWEEKGEPEPFSTYALMQRRMAGIKVDDTAMAN